MKNKLYKPSLLLFVAILAAGVFMTGTNYASATGAASFNADTTVALDVGNLTITSGSDADSVTTSNTQVTVGISSGQSFTLESTDRFLLTNDSGYTYECLSGRSTITITSSTTKTVIITPSSNTCGTSSGGGGGGGGGGSSGAGATISAATSTSTPTPTPTSSPASTTTPTSTPSPSGMKFTPASKGFTSLSTLKLKEGDVISAAGSSDPDVYIVNAWGYKRLFLNPAIFKFYGHLGGFSKVKTTTVSTRDTLVTSGLFRNCETNDKKVYGVEATGEDVGALHWVNTTGDQAVKDDPDFFKKVFCINTKEFNWYPQGAAYTSVNQIADYSRKNVSSTPSPTPSPTPAVTKQYKVVNTNQVNVRALASTASAILGKLPAGQIVESLGQSGLWHKIKYQTKDGWVHSDYLQAVK